MYPALTKEHAKTAPHRQILHQKQTKYNDEYDDDNEVIDDGSWRDIFWAILFYISVILMLVLAVMSVSTGKLNKVFGKHGADDRDSKKEEFDFTVKSMFVAVGISVSAIFTAVWLAIMTFCASGIIKVCLILLPILSFVASAIAFAAGQMIIGVVMVISGAIGLIYAYFVWSRVPFATVCLNIAIAAFNQFKMPIFVNFLCVILGIGMLVIDILASPFILGEKNQGAKYFSAFIWFVFVFWHMMVALNVAHTAACGVMASFFFGRETDGVTMGAFKRAITTSFGSICFGSLLTALVRALQMIIRMARDQNQEDGNLVAVVILCCLECLVRLLGDILEYFNAYVYVQIAVYGKKYWDAAKDTWELFKNTGITAIINDDLTSYPIAVGALLNLVLIIGSIWMIGHGEKWGASAVIAGFVGCMINFGVCQVLESNVKTLFVCWAENPAEFQLNRPILFQKMIVAAQNAGHNTDFAVVGNV